MLPDTILRSKDVMRILNCSRSQSYLIMAKFTRVQLSIRSWGIYQNELEAYFNKLNGG
jgi:hypothetical protein